MTTTHPTCPTCHQPVSHGRAIAFTDALVFHRGCLVTPPAPGPLTRRLWEAGQRCRMAS